MRRLPRLAIAAASLAAIAATLQTARNTRRLPSVEPLAAVEQIEQTSLPDPDRVSVLLPVRDEADNLMRCLPSLLAQSGIDELIILDDGSTDKTYAIATALTRDARTANAVQVRVTSSPSTELPVGWLGKTWACERLAQLASGNVLVFVDADVALEPTAVSSAVQSLRELQLDMLSPYPRQETTTTLTRLVQPLLQWSWLTFIPGSWSMARQPPSMAVGNGQFAILDADAYRAVGGHAAVAGDVLEDVGLARALRQAGFRTAVADGSAIATCRMYESNSDLVSGYTKSLWTAFGSEAGAVAVTAMLNAVYVVPPVVAISTTDRVARGWGIVGYIAAVTGRVIVARRTNQRVWPDAAAHPASIIALSTLTARSVWNHRRGQLTWKGRSIS